MNNNNQKKPLPIGLILSYLLPVLVIAMIFLFINQTGPKNGKLTQGELITQLQKQNVDTAIYQDGKLRGTLKDENHTPFEAVIPRTYFPDFYQDYMKAGVEAGTLKMTFKEDSEPNAFLTLLPNILFYGFMAYMMFALFRRMQSQSGGMNAFGKSKARMNRDSGKRVTFADVAGLKEEKEELQEIVDFLKNPRKFTTVGARIPKGVLLVGPPGTGKTYLSKAVAGEAGVPFFSISGSDFVEMFVGVGASRVRDLFQEGKKNAPCIIFIDEIDAVGRRRGAGLGGGNDEREQTLNQLLVELDGFDQNEGIIIMAATNRPDILDPALLRPGRFDRQILVGNPDVREREEVLRVHLRNKKTAEDVDLRALARQTGGFTPADLENMTNEAALLTARKNETVIDMATFEEAAIRITAGPEKKSRRVIEKERTLTAYHEAGHAIVTRALPSNDEVNLITIVPRGYAGGFTSFLPDEDRMFRSRNDMLIDLVTFLGGRAAEALVLKDISTGASNDIERATRVARSMIVKYGMSPDLGPVALEEEKDNVFLGNDLGQIRTYSEKTAEQIDQEVHHLMTRSLSLATEILELNRELLEALAQRLLEIETMRREEFEDLFRQYGHVRYLEKGDFE
ncbi:MAG: ATP-dependent zinc metalloprotease FtsH [Peptoniphilaceae bacterium]|nr:ATP-dependent zinc metalloprotease FtsH [Peptoniphilaceae bacterium]MCI6659464.1 ATP-dependent zinc metalloprotease FtsH [Peptoniphilaceae bacterium]MDD7433644.1 ATP-dependent zinc metalloprotease FtsH [Peptoniphilaceae bacterium]MDY3076109.1 ATP-dependent zinc metalloprotease FtsH [Peptoniphilaceae bacterium]MDY4197043.1 ATP-dependent zinc metalloprotease FtsH [Peptoniphilaceae bacterium]